MGRRFRTPVIFSLLPQISPRTLSTIWPLIGEKQYSLRKEAWHSFRQEKHPSNSLDEPFDVTVSPAHVNRSGRTANSNPPILGAESKAFTAKRRQRLVPNERFQLRDLHSIAAILPCITALFEANLAQKMGKTKLAILNYEKALDCHIRDLLIH